jgi:hypothetical protein
MATSCLAQQRGIFHTETNETTFMIHHARDVPPSRVQARGVETGGGSMMAVIDFIQGLICLGVAVSFYMLPAYVAFGRHLANRWSLALVNLVFGWTLIGWVFALAWAIAGTAKVGPVPNA